MTGQSILLADDDAGVRLVASQALAQAGFKVRATSTFSAMMKWIDAGEGDLLISDVYTPDGAIFELMPRIKQRRADMPIIIISGESTVVTAASAVENGAFDYLPKPFDIDALVASATRALAKGGGKALANPNERRASKDASLPLIGRSAAMQSVYRVIGRVMNNDLPVLIEGEPGVGKERVARTIHKLGHRRDGPLEVIRIGGASADSLRHDLFEAGGGVVERLRGGTLVLDDVDAANTECQALIVRLLQAIDDDVESDTAKPAPRVVACTSANLKRVASDGDYREDLFYRLSVVRIRLPALRERQDDIPDLARAFLAYAAEDGLEAKSMDEGALDVLRVYHWPGNVRELESLMRRVAALTPGPRLTAEALRAETLSRDDEVDEEPINFESEIEAVIVRHYSSAFAKDGEDAGNIHNDIVSAVERPLIRLALRATAGNKVKAAALLGVNRNTLRAKIQSLDVATED